MWKFYMYISISILLIVLSVTSFISHSYWQGVGEIFVGLLGLFVSVGLYSDVNKFKK